MSQTNAQEGTQAVKYHHNGIPVSNTAVNLVLRSIQDGSYQDTVAAFFASRPDWQDKPEEKQA